MKIFISVPGEISVHRFAHKDFEANYFNFFSFLEISLNFLPPPSLVAEKHVWNKPSLKSPRRRSKKIGNTCWLHKTHQPKRKRWAESLRNYHLSEINLRSFVKFNWSASFSSGSKPDSAACLRWLNASQANGNKEHGDDYKLKMQPNCCTWSRSAAKSIFVIYDHLANRIRDALAERGHSAEKINFTQLASVESPEREKSSNLFKKMKTTTQSSISMGLVWSNT